jgi:hypothetical protein
MALSRVNWTPASGDGNREFFENREYAVPKDYQERKVRPRRLLASTLPIFALNNKNALLQIIRREKMDFHRNLRRHFLVTRFRSGKQQTQVLD